MENDLKESTARIALLFIADIIRTSNDFPLEKPTDAIDRVKKEIADYEALVK